MPTLFITPRPGELNLGGFLFLEHMNSSKKIQDARSTCFFGTRLSITHVSGLLYVAQERRSTAAQTHVVTEEKYPF